MPHTDAVLIMCLSHSGSTLLDLTLSSHPQIVGLGEIHNFFKKWLVRIVDGEEKGCSCGQTARECPFWGPIINEFAARQITPSIDEGYEVVRRHFDEIYPEGTILLDSSKKLSSREALRRSESDAVRILLLARDVRGWLSSYQDRRPRIRPSFREELAVKGLRRSVALELADTSVGLSWRWKTAYEKMLDNLDGGSEPYLVVSYERLCFETEDTVREIIDWMGVPLPDRPLSPGAPGGHAVTGNEMRITPQRRRSITYDTRWLKRAGWMPGYQFVPGVRELNERLVWSRRRPRDEGRA